MTNRQEIQQALDDTDGRIGYSVVSMATAQAINRACTAALARRGIETVRFNRMDFAGPAYMKNKKKEEEE